MTRTKVCEIQDSERDALIIEHLAQVELIARRMLRGMPPSINLDDLVSAGHVGLITAVDRYNPDQGVKLKTYAEHKIRGAILDSLRALAWSPRPHRQRARMIDSAVAVLERQNNRHPSEEEVAAYLGLELEGYRAWLLEAHHVKTRNSQPGKGKEDVELLRRLADSMERLPSTLFERAEVASLLTRAVARLPLIEQKVLQLYFRKEMTLREISRVLRLHESRVSQLKTQAILKLRPALGSHRPTKSNETTDKRAAVTRATRQTASVFYDRARSAPPSSCPAPRPAPADRI